jgi:hypothetical protein
MQWSHSKCGGVNFLHASLEISLGDRFQKLCDNSFPKRPTSRFEKEKKKSWTGQRTFFRRPDGKQACIRGYKNAISQGMQMNRYDDRLQVQFNLRNSVYKRLRPQSTAKISACLAGNHRELSSIQVRSLISTRFRENFLLKSFAVKTGIPVGKANRSAL